MSLASILVYTNITNIEDKILFKLRTAFGLQKDIKDILNVSFLMAIDKITNLDRPANTFQWALVMPHELLSIKNEPIGIILGTIPEEYVEKCTIDLKLFSSIGQGDIVYTRTKYPIVQRPELGTMSIEFYEDENYTTTQHIF